VTPRGSACPFQDSLDIQASITGQVGLQTQVRMRIFRLIIYERRLAEQMQPHDEHIKCVTVCYHVRG
jgi:hypothetical protein